MIEPESQSIDRGRIWAWVPVLLLGSMLLGLGVMAYIALDDPHFSLEPNYYDKAVHWDRAQTEARESAALGLVLTLPPTLALAEGGRVELELRVADRDGAALSDATVEVEAFPNAYASRVERLVLRQTSPGVYQGQLGHGVRGLWELRLSVTRGGQRFHQVLRRDVLKGGAA